MYLLTECPSLLPLFFFYQFTSDSTICTILASLFIQSWLLSPPLSPSVGANQCFLTWIELLVANPCLVTSYLLFLPAISPLLHKSEVEVQPKSSSVHFPPCCDSIPKCPSEKHKCLFPKKVSETVTHGCYANEKVTTNSDHPLSAYSETLIQDLAHQKTLTALTF